MNELRVAIIWMIEEGVGVLDDSQQAVVDAYNNLPNVEPIDVGDYQDDDEGESSE